MLIITRKTFRFPNPNVAILGEAGEQPKQKEFSEVFCDTKPGEGGKFGEPQEVPDWVQKDRMFKMATDDGDLQIITAVKSKASNQAALNAAKNQQQGSQSALDHSDLDKMTKAQIVAHAEDEHDLELDEKLPKDELIEKVKAAREEQAKA